MRQFVVENARYWIRDFHLDGLRLDATQSMFDRSETHIIAEIIAQSRARSRAARSIVVIAENEPQRSEHLRSPRAGGFGLDAMWNDDFHHAAKVALTGSRDGYFDDYTGRAQEFISCVRHGFLYQGQWYDWQNSRAARSASGLPPYSFIVFLAESRSGRQHVRRRSRACQPLRLAAIAR